MFGAFRATDFDTDFLAATLNSSQLCIVGTLEETTFSMPVGLLWLLACCSIATTTSTDSLISGGSASSVSGNHGLANLYDGDPKTIFHTSTKASTEWVRLDFTRPVRVAAISVQNR